MEKVATTLKVTEGQTMASSTDGTNWEQIARAMGERLLMAVTHFKPNAGPRQDGLILNIEDGSTQHWKDYFADAIEMVPGMKIDRELMHASRSQRLKIITQRKKRATVNSNS